MKTPNKAFLNPNQYLSSDDNSSNENLLNYQTESEYHQEEDEDHEEEDDQMREIKKQQQLQRQEKLIREQLKNVSFGQLIKHQQLTSSTRKTKQKPIKKHPSKPSLPIPPPPNHPKTSPHQIKIMRKPPKTKFKPIFPPTHSKPIDPRFQQYTGSYNPGYVKQSYSFIKQLQNNQLQYLKKQLSNKKNKQQTHQILIKNYNKLTNDIKKLQHQQLEKQVKNKYKNQNYNPKRRQLKQQVQRKKMEKMGEKEFEKKLRKKSKKIQKARMIERKIAVQRTMKHQ